MPTEGSAKAIALGMLDRFPRIKRVLRRTYLTLRPENLAHRLRGLGRFPDPCTIEVPPDKIRLRIKNKFDKFKNKGRVLDGDWDRKEVYPLETMDALRAFEDHFRNGVDWSKTEFYKYTLQEINSGVVKWGCKDRSDLDARFRKIEDLYRDIRDHGYKSQREFPDKKGTAFEYYDEVSVCINRYGDLMFSDGRHRLSIAKILNLPSIPVQVTYRHRQWQDFRERVIDYAKRNKGKVYAPLLHPDLSHIPWVHGHQRFELLRDSLPLRGGSVPDVGSHWGYFSHRFEQEGFDCYAVESSESYLYFLEKLRRAEQRKFHVIRQSILEPMEKNDFDVVLALNIFHHFIKTEGQYNKLIGLLGRLDMKIMYFEPHHPTEGQMRDSFRNYSPEKFVEFILEHSCLTASRLLGASEDGRPLYMLSR